MTETREPTLVAVEEWLKLMVRYRVQRATVPTINGAEMELELHPSAFAPANVNVASSAPAPVGWAAENPTEDQLLHMSGIPMTDEEIRTQPPEKSNG